MDVKNVIKKYKMMIDMCEDVAEKRNLLFGLHYLKTSLERINVEEDIYSEFEGDNYNNRKLSSVFKNTISVPKLVMRISEIISVELYNALERNYMGGNECSFNMRIEFPIKEFKGIYDIDLKQLKEYIYKLCEEDEITLFIYQLEIGKTTLARRKGTLKFYFYAPIAFRANITYKGEKK